MKRFPWRTVYENTALAFPVRLIQTGADRFRVEYGQQVRRGLTYGEAARELGSAIMHALACDGKIVSPEEPAGDSIR